MLRVTCVPARTGFSPACGRLHGGQGCVSTDPQHRCLLPSAQGPSDCGGHPPT